VPSRWVVNPEAKRKHREPIWPRLDAVPFSVGACRFGEKEVHRFDPKEDELYLCRLKPEEILVEDRSDTDVQIVRRTWAKRRKTNRIFK